MRKLWASHHIGCILFANGMIIGWEFERFVHFHSITCHNIEPWASFEIGLIGDFRAQWPASVLVFGQNQYVDTTCMWTACRFQWIDTLRFVEESIIMRKQCWHACYIDMPTYIRSAHNAHNCQHFEGKPGKGRISDEILLKAFPYHHFFSEAQFWDDRSEKGRMNHDLVVTCVV